jgi:Lrp/AsnC family transcriptional regulator, leucine-responsive regulatory protein
MAKKDTRIKSPSYALDEHDRRLLAALQVSTRRTLEDLSRLVALSPSSVRRRLERLRQNGAIRAEIALLDPAVLEQGIRVLTLVNFAREGASVYREFRRRIASEPRVLLSNPSIGRYDSFVVWSTVKELAQPMLRQP